MRQFSLLIILTVFVTGCMSMRLHQQCDVLAVDLGVPKEEVLAIARQISKQHQLKIVLIEKTSDGEIEMHLGTNEHGGGGILVYIKKIDGHLQEDTTKQGLWME